VSFQLKDKSRIYKDINPYFDTNIRAVKWPVEKALPIHKHIKQKKIRNSFNLCIGFKPRILQNAP
jgi:hypothetical protein